MALSLNRMNNAGVSDILDFSSKSSKSPSSPSPPPEGDETSTNSAEESNNDTATIASTNGSIQNPPHQTHRSNHINNSNSNHGNNNSKTMFDVSRPRESSASQSLTSRNKRKNFKPRNICIYDDDEEENHYNPDKVGNSDASPFALSESEIDDEDDNHRHSNGIFSNQSQPLDLSREVRGDSSSTNSTPEPVPSNAKVSTVQHQSISSFRSSDDKGSSCSDDTSVPIVSTKVSTPTTKKTTTTTSSSSSPSIPMTGFSSSSSPPSSLPLLGSGDDVRTPLGFWRPGVISGIAPWIDPSFLTGSGALASKLEALQRSGSVDYTRYVKRFGNAAECGSAVCRELNYREHFHCLDCNSRVFVKKEEMIRHFKWHKKRDESLQHGFMRYSPCDDCSDKFPNCAHNRKQTHYHCLKLGCEKTYISTSDVQMHANYHRKDTAIIQEGFQRFRATEDCLTPSCPFQGQKTTHFHCRRSNCGFTFKNKADMEKHKSFHIRDEQLTRDGFKKFTKHEPCPFDDCRFSRVCNHIHCIRAGCNHVFHSSGQLYSHKRKHEKSESDVDASPAESQSQSSFADQQASSSLQQSQSQSSSSVTPAIPSQPLSSLSTLPANLSQGPITETYPTGTTLTSIDGLPVFKRKRGRPPKNQVVEVPPFVTSSSAPSQSLRHSLPPRTTSSSSLTSSSPSSSSTTPGTFPSHHHPFLSPSLPPEATALFNHPAFNLPLGLSPFGLAAAMSSNPSFAAAMTGSSSTSMDGLIPVPMLPLLQLFNLPNPAAAYGLHPQLSSQLSPPQTSSSSSVSLSMPQQNRTESASPQDDSSSEGSEAKKIRPNSAQQSGTSTPRPVVKDEPVPDGYMRYRFNEDCGYSYCGYREHQTHFHCMRKACGYSFCDKTRFVQHTARHERLDTLMGDEFQQFRSNINCGYFGCPHSPANNSGQPASPANKASHFHCLKCDFVCTDTNRVVAHRRQHHKMDSINAAGFEKYTPSQDCGVESCIHVRRQTHYHCLQCQYAVLGLSQMSSHKYKHAQE